MSCARRLASSGSSCGTRMTDPSRWRRRGQTDRRGQRSSWILRRSSRPTRLATDSAIAGCAFPSAAATSASRPGAAGRRCTYGRVTRGGSTRTPSRPFSSPPRCWASHWSDASASERPAVVATPGTVRRERAATGEHGGVMQHAGTRGTTLGFMAGERPDPEALLARIKEQEARQARGKLKLFFGAAAGVGKTYAMLEAARERRDEAIDVIVGYVETHGRAETESLLQGLELLPARLVEYRGTTLREFDLDAALARRPAIVLVDELAHTNAAGSRHAKRWQDVQELLEAGIDVYTTLNVQHLESLNDIVAKITGVIVRETVPDSVLEEADEVELIDLPPD